MEIKKEMDKPRLLFDTGKTGMQRDDT